jgi:hypothetical protein
MKRGISPEKSSLNLQKKAASPFLPEGSGMLAEASLLIAADYTLRRPQQQLWFDFRIVCC